MFSFAVFNKTYTYQLLFKNTCDIEGHIVLDKSKFKESKIKLRNFPLVNHVKWEMKTTLSKGKKQEFKIHFKFRNGVASGNKIPNINFEGEYHAYITLDKTAQRVKLFQKDYAPGRLHATLDSGEASNSTFYLLLDQTQVGNE